VSRPDDGKDLDEFTKGSIVIFTGIFGAGSILLYREQMVHDTFTLCVFWLTIIAFALSAFAGVVLRIRRRYGQREPRGAMPVVLLLGFIAGLIGLTILSMCRKA
jgi:amino acid transporter